jgi:hypothetical protein
MLLGKAREGLSATERRELDEALQGLAELPGVQRMSWGVNTSERSRGYTHGAVMHFADRTALQGYQQADGHRAIVQVLDRLMPERLVVDYETETSGIST